MSRNFGMKMLTMTNLSTECLIQLTKLGYDATPFNQILKQNAKREMRLRLGKVTVADVLAAQPVTTNLLKFMRASIKMIGVSNLQSFIASMTQKLTLLLTLLVILTMPLFLARLTLIPIKSLSICFRVI